MDGLFALNPGAFAQLATHISVYHQPMSPGYQNMAVDLLRDTVGLWRWPKYTLWNVPGMGSLQGKVVPLDVHGWYVVLDEQEVSNRFNMSVSTLKYAFLMSGQRRKEGGRRVYDFVTMNFGIAVGAILGASWVRHGSTRFSMFDRRPVLKVATGLAIWTAGFVTVRVGFRFFGVGAMVAERSHATAINRIDCVDCFEDIIEFTEEQIAELKTAKLPDPKPGQPPITPELDATFKQNVISQGKLLRSDQVTMRDLQQKMLVRCGVDLGPKSKEEKQAAKLKRLGVLASEKPSWVPEASQPAELGKAISALTESSLPSVVARPIPSSCLCSLHRELRSNPEEFVHPREWPIFPRDRQNAKLRGPVA